MNDKPRLLERAKEILKEWHAPVPDLLACTHVDTLRGGGIYDRPMPDSKPWRRNADPKCHNITILGDAAHPMVFNSFASSFNLFKVLIFPHNISY